jgi:hypothetical protein
LPAPLHVKPREKIMCANAPTRPDKMKRAAIYARFSTDLQDERSIEDQVTLCRKYA